MYCMYICRHSKKSVKTFNYRLHLINRTIVIKNNYFGKIIFYQDERKWYLIARSRLRKNIEKKEKSRKNIVFSYVLFRVR